MITNRPYAKKVLHVVHIQESLEVGGMENGIVNLVNHFDNNRFVLSLYCLNKMGSLVSRLSPDKARIICFEQPEGIRPGLIFKLVKVLKEDNVDIVHTHNFYSGLYGILAARLANIPIVVHGEHGTLILNNPIRSIIMNVLALLIDNFLVVSADLKKRLLERILIPSGRVRVLMNGVDTQKFRIQAANEELRVICGVPNKSFVFGSVGRLVPVKNHRLLITVKKMLDDSGFLTNCFIIGSGPCRGELERYATELRTEINFLGERNDISHVLSIFDLFVLTSFNEGMSNTILEAMACGKPVAATKVGGNSELVLDNKTGFLFTSNNAQELFDIITRCIRNKTFLSQMAGCAREIVEQKFSLSAMVRNYEKIYLALAKEKGLLR